MSAGTSGTGDGDPCRDPGMEATLPPCLQRISHFSLLKHMVFLFNNGSGSRLGREKENTFKGPSSVWMAGRQGARGGGWLSKSLAQGSALGSLLGGPPNQARAPTTLVGYSQLLCRAWNVRFQVPSASRPIVWGDLKGVGSQPGPPERRQAVTLLVPGGCNVRGLGTSPSVSGISPTERIFLPFYGGGN